MNQRAVRPGKRFRNATEVSQSLAAGVTPVIQSSVDNNHHVAGKDMCVGFFVLGFSVSR